MIQSTGQTSSLFNYFKIAAIFAILYLFLVSIGMIGTGFKGLGRGFAEQLMSSNAAPLIGLFIGILATSLIQSSSTTTSIVVGMVAAGTFGEDPILAVATASLISWGRISEPVLRIQSFPLDILLIKMNFDVHLRLRLSMIFLMLYPY